MAIAGSVAIALAERVEKSGGPRAGLVAWRALAANASDAETRAKALIAGLRCALSLRDESGIDDLVALWPSIDRGDWSAPVAALCKDLVRAKLGAFAIDLSAAEMTRNRTAHALYTHARCLDVAADARAVEWFGRTVERAESEGAAAIANAARVRRTVLLAKSWATLAEALAEAAKLDLAKLEWPARIDIARVLLLSPSRFTRAGAIGQLADAANVDDVAIRRRARRLAARYADEAADSVTPLEHDRLNVVIKDALRAPPVVAERAGDLLRGRYEVPREPPEAPADPVKRRIARHHEILDVFAALRDDSSARAARALRALAVAQESDERLPREVVAVAQAALAKDDAELRGVALRFFAAWLKRPSYIAPPRGFVALADALGDAGAPELALLARRGAALRKEAGAAQSLGVLLARVGWEAARADNRPHAIQTLREAKALSTG